MSETSDNNESLENETIDIQENEVEFKEKDKSLKDEYDTDIEITEENIGYDHTGKSAYIKSCRKEGVIPAGYFLRHMNDKKLVMRHHGLSVSEIRPICISLMNNGSINVLDLTDNWLGDESVPYIMAMMKENCFISHLTLSKNNLTSKSAQLINLGLSDNMQIKMLNLSHNNFDDKSAPAFGDLMMYSKINQLDLSKNQFGSNCLATFGKCISQSTDLVELNLSWNHLGGKETKQFCAGITENISIIKLNLSWNGLGLSQSMTDFGKMLKTNTILEYIDLSNNRITAEGAVLLGKGLTTNNTLKHLKLGQNPIQTAGCYAILSSILKNPSSTIEYLDFEDIRVNQDFIDLKATASETLMIYTGSKKAVRPSSSIHPIKRFRIFSRKHQISPIEYFQHFNDAENSTLTINDFRLAIQYFCRDYKFDLTESEVELLINHLDKKQDGLINFRDLIEQEVQTE